MNKKGIALSARTMAILILALIFFVLALTFTLRGNKVIAYFETEIVGRTPKTAYSNFLRQCRLACRTADGNFDQNLEGEKANNKYDYCNITMNTTELGGDGTDHCYDEEEGVANMTCKIKTVNGEDCNIGDSNGCDRC